MLNERPCNIECSVVNPVKPILARNTGLIIPNFEKVNLVRLCEDDRQDLVGCFYFTSLRKALD